MIEIQVRDFYGKSVVPNTWQGVEIAKLDAILQELRKLNTLLHCGNAIEIPSILRRIDKNTKKRPRKKKVKA